MPLNEVGAITRAGGAPANKIVEVEGIAEWVRPLFDQAAARLDLGDSGEEAHIFDMTYCLAPGDPRRVWAFLLLQSRTLYPLLWDPEHRVSGYDPGKWRTNPNGPDPKLCTGCLHPV